MDVLRDDAFAFAEALEAEGTEVEVYGYGGVPHCFPELLKTTAETALFYTRYNAFLEKYASSS